MENTFWNISRLQVGDSNFVKIFKKSFTVYVESGTRKKVEADIECLEIASDEFKEKFFKLIIENKLRKFHCFYL